MNACPEREELAAWSFGLLVDPRTGEIARHVCDCPGCVSTLEAIGPPADPLLERCRHPLAPDTILEEPECLRLIAEVASIEENTQPRRVDPRSSEVSLGSRLGPYEILAWIGGGGMGTVYRARHTHLDRVVAIKVLPPDRLLNPQAVSRFRREMKSVGALDHPNIIQARDAGEAAGTHYLVMELVEGRDLARLVAQRGPLPVAEACEIIRQAAEGLDHAFRKGLVHRDIKPSNIVLALDGRVKLLDLGLALLRGDRLPQDDLTGLGQVMGTAAYMAPEQATDPHAVDVRADLYSLGCTLFFLLAGQAPYDHPGRRTPIQLIMAHAQEPIPPIREIRPDVPEGLAALLARLLAKSPADRIATPAELSTALRPFCDAGRAGPPSTLDGVPSPVADDTEVEPRIGEVAAIAEARPSPPRRRPPYRAAVAAALIPIAALLAYPIIVIIKDRDGKEVGRHDVPEGGSVQVAPGAVAPAPVTIAAPIASRPAIETGPPMGPAALVPTPARIRGVESWTIETRRHRSGAVAVAHDPGGRWLALSSQDGSIRLFDAATGRLVRALVGQDSSGSCYPLAWRPGSSVLASGGEDRAIRLWDAETGRVLRVLRGHKHPVRSLAWSPDGKTLASGGGDGDNSRLWDFESGRCVEELPRTLGGLAWSPDGRKLATIPGGDVIVIHDVADHSSRPLNDERIAMVGVAWSPDGKTIAAPCPNLQQVLLWDAQTGKRLPSLEGCQGATSVAWSPDGSKLAAGNNGNAKIFEATTGKLLATMPSRWDTVVIGLSWSPDGKSLAGADQYQSAYVWDVKTGRESREHRPHVAHREIRTPWSPDGRMIVMNADGGAGLWDSASGRPIRRIPWDNGNAVESAAFSPDGRLLALAVGGAIRIEDAESGRRVVTIPGLENHIRSMAWSPDGRSLALSTEKGVRVLDADAGSRGLLLEGGAGDSATAAWSPDGKTLAATVGREIRLLDPTSGKLIRALPTEAGWIADLAWSPDGRRIASGSNREPYSAGVLQLWDAGTGRLLRTREAQPGGIATVRWSSDGKTIVTGGGRELIAWDAESGKPTRSLATVGGFPSPDLGRAVGSSAAAVRLHDVEADRPLGVIVAVGDPLALAISPEGHYRGSPGIESEIVHVVQTKDGQETLTPEEFARKYGWKNDPGRVNFAP